MEKPTARVSVSLGYTMNMGDYSSARFDFGLACDIAGVDERAIRDEFKRLLILVNEQANTHRKRLSAVKGP